MEAPILVIVGGVALFIVLAAISAAYERKRQAALAELASQLGLRFSTAKDYQLASRFDYLNGLNRGSDRYVRCVMSGRLRDHEVVVFEHHHQTTSTDSKGRRRTSHHWHSVVLASLPTPCPEVTIAREGFLSKVAQALGYADIDFESHEFSRSFVVRSKDRRFAYDLIHPRVMELLLDRIQQFGTIEFERSSLALMRSGRLEPRRIAADLDLVLDLRELFPEHVQGATHG